MIHLHHHCPQIAVLTLDHVQRCNALSKQMLKRFLEILRDLKHDPTLRVLLLQGEGRMFCSGIDLKEAKESPENAAEMFHDVVQIFIQLRQFPQIVLSAVHGGAYGGGTALIASSDFVLAADDLKLATPEVLRGFDPVLLFPLLRRKLSDSALRQLLLTGEPVDAVRAKEIGLVHEIVTDGKNLREEAIGKAETLCRTNSKAAQSAKLMLAAHENQLFPMTLEEEMRFSLSAHLKSWKELLAQSPHAF